MTHIKHSTLWKNTRKGGKRQGARRDFKLIQLLVLKCINDQSERGTVKHDIMFRCELNHYYLGQVMEALLNTQAIYAVDPIDNDEQKYTLYYITQKGLELMASLEVEARTLGYTNTDINRARV